MGTALGCDSGNAPLGLPKNATTGRPYSGINVVILWGAVSECGFPAQSWLTFRQALNLGGNVLRGEHGAPSRGISEALHRLQRGAMRGPA